VVCRWKNNCVIVVEPRHVPFTKSRRVHIEQALPIGNTLPAAKLPPARCWCAM